MTSEYQGSTLAFNLITQYLLQIHPRTIVQKEASLRPASPPETRKPFGASDP